MNRNNQIAITKIENENVEKAVFRALELIKAKELFLNKKLKVLIKPNILIAKAPERAVTTHPAIIKSLIKWLKQFNPEKIIVGESSGTFKRGATENAFEISGLKKVCEEEGVEWTPFEKTTLKTYKVKNPLILEEITASKLLEEVDVIINVPKIKTHHQCILTCTIKNMFGTLILGNKMRTHAQFPSKERFNSALADIYSVSNPQLTVVDGYYCQEGNGPSAGDIVKLDIILAGYDPVALDTAVCRIIDINPKDIIYISKLQEKGFGNSNYEIVGESIETVKRKFKMSKIIPVSIPLPKFLAKYVSKTILRSDIKFNKNKCKLCSTCWSNCPAQAISPPKELKQGKYVPKWHNKRCITCYCCAELCPYEAVEFKVNLIKNIFTSWLFLLFISLLFGAAFLIWIIFKIITMFL